MSEYAEGLSSLVDQQGLREQLLLQMELMRLDTLLRNFTPLRERLVASGLDASAKYHQLQTHRDGIVAELAKRRLDPIRRASAVVRPPNHMSEPIAAVRFPSGVAFPWFGFSGTVQLGPATEGINVVPPGTTGSILTAFLGGNGRIFFGGDLAALAIEGFPTNPGPLADTDLHFWLRNWTYLIPFPAPSVDSTLTYRFDVVAHVGVALSAAEVALGWAFASVGETANFTGQPVAVTTGVGFPFAEADLTIHTGNVSGRVTVQRSIDVRAGRVPAVALVVGFSAGLGPKDEVIFNHDFCVIVPASGGAPGVVTFRYDPNLVAQQ